MFDFLITFRMLSLLKLPLKIGGNSNNTAAEASTSQSESSQDDKLWYLKELFPTLDSDVVEQVLRSTRSMDEAESKLLTMSCDDGRSNADGRVSSVCESIANFANFKSFHGSWGTLLSFVLTDWGGGGAGFDLCTTEFSWA